MKKDDIRKKVEEGKDRWLIWCGFIMEEDDEKRKIEYFGKFAPTKKSVIGLLKSIIDNTDVYRIIVQDTEIFKTDPSLLQTELKDFFMLEDEERAP